MKTNAVVISHARENGMDVALVGPVVCHEVLGSKRYARDLYNMIGLSPVVPGRNAAACIDCGKCEDKCPQKIQIAKQLGRAHELLSG